MTLRAADLSTIEFEGQIAGDETAFIDNVSITAVPEPATWARMLVGFGSLGAMMPRKAALADARA